MDTHELMMLCEPVTLLAYACMPGRRTVLVRSEHMYILVLCIHTVSTQCYVGAERCMHVHGFSPPLGMYHSLNGL